MEMSDYYFSIAAIAFISAALNVILFFVGWQSEQDVLELQEEYAAYRSIVKYRLIELHEMLDANFDKEVDDVKCRYTDLSEEICDLEVSLLDVESNESETEF